MDYEEPNNAIKAGALLRAASLQQASLGPAKLQEDTSHSDDHSAAGSHGTQPKELVTWSPFNRKHLEALDNNGGGRPSQFISDAAWARLGPELGQLSMAEAGAVEATWSARGSGLERSSNEVIQLGKENLLVTGLPLPRMSTGASFGSSRENDEEARGANNRDDDSFRRSALATALTAERKLRPRPPSHPKAEPATVRKSSQVRAQRRNLDTRSSQRSKSDFEGAAGGQVIPDQAVVEDKEVTMLGTPLETRKTGLQLQSAHVSRKNDLKADQIAEHVEKDETIKRTVGKAKPSITSSDKRKLSRRPLELDMPSLRNEKAPGKSTERSKQVSSKSNASSGRPLKRKRETASVNGGSNAKAGRSASVGHGSKGFRIATEKGPAFKGDGKVLSRMEALASIESGTWRKRCEEQQLELVKKKDPRKAARMLANRRSAERSRVRRLERIANLEAEVDELVAERESYKKRLTSAQSMHKKSLEEIKKLKMEMNDTPSNKRGGRKVDVKILEEALAAKDRELEEKKEELEPIQREVEKMHEELAKMEREVQRKDAELQTKDRLIECFHAVLMQQQLTASTYMHSGVTSAPFGSATQMTLPPTLLPGGSGRVLAPIAIPPTPEFPLIITDPGPGLVQLMGRNLSNQAAGPEASQTSS